MGVLIDSTPQNTTKERSTMRKTVAFFLATTLLLAMCIPVSAAENSIQPYYINTNQAKVLMGIDDDGLASINVTCIGNSNATRIQITTYIEKLVGSTWVRVSIGQVNNQWTASTTARYLAKNYSHQLTTAGSYRAVAVFTVSGSTSETFTLYCEATY